MGWGWSGSREVVEGCQPSLDNPGPLPIVNTICPSWTLLPTHCRRGCLGPICHLNCQC